MVDFQALRQSAFIIDCLCWWHMEKPLEKGHPLRHRMEDLKYCRNIQKFLTTFKVQKCSILHDHKQQHCIHYHQQKDRRRDPYFLHKFLYYPYSLCSCESAKCPKYHTPNEKTYHPLLYKTQKCPNYNDCQQKLTCPYVHSQDDLHFGQGQFFRFDITLFKTKPCLRKEPHQRKVCLNFHNDKDRRRPNFSDYSHILCAKQCCKQNCSKAHNKIEQLYHPSRYKSKYCQTYPNDVDSCDYRDFCSFAHKKQEITIELLDPDNKDATYIINNYKTIWCPFTKDHQRGDCVYAHNIQDYRRRPKDYKYIPEKCEAWNFQNKIQSLEEAGCKAGMQCNKCHGWNEQKYHPLIFKKTNRSYVRKEELVDKKLRYDKEVRKKSKQSRIDQIAMKEVVHAGKYAVGAPFFKNDQDQSEASKKTKAKTGHIGSDRSCDGSDNNKDVHIEAISTAKKGFHNIASGYYFEEWEHHLWNFQGSAGNIKEETVRSKSEGKSDSHEPSYSQSIVQSINDQVILQKLRNYKVHEVRLIGIGESKIHTLNFLNSDQKAKLVSQLKAYSLKKKLVPLDYSLQLTRFFTKNHANSILQKLKQKSVNEQKLLKLHSRQTIKDLSYLTEQEKIQLPKLVKGYCEEREFGALMYSVNKYVDEPVLEQ